MIYHKNMDIKMQFKVGDLIRPTKKALETFAPGGVYYTSNQQHVLNNRTYIVKFIKRKLHGNQCEQISIDIDGPGSSVWGSPWFELDKAAIFNNKLNALIND